jgi:hypothetical protein
MGKLTVNEADKLVSKGILSNKALKEMQVNGLVSTRRRGTKRYMKTADNKWVTPQLYFQGFSGGSYSNKMTEFKNDFNELIKKYTVERETNKKGKNTK